MLMSLKSRREPIFNLPTVVTVSIVVMVAIHGIRMLLPEEWDDLVLGLFAFSPDRYLVGDDEGAPWPGGLPAAIWSPFTYALLHNDLLHLLSNCTVFAALGNVLARRTTASRFLVFCVVTAPLSAAGELIIAAYQSAPVIGVSGVLCAMMGGLARFMFSAPAPEDEPDPDAGFDDPLEETEAQRISANRISHRHGVTASRQAPVPTVAPLLETLRRPKVIQFILAFALMNIILVIAAPVLVAGGAGVAWMVHVAGFIAGIVLWPWFDRIRA